MRILLFLSFILDLILSMKDFIEAVRYANRASV